MNKNRSESTIVKIAAIHNGIPNKMYKAVAEPRTSYMSDPIIANSVMTHRMYLVFYEYCSEAIFARLRWVTTPILDAMDW